jgi:hypothetical protein
VRPTGLPGLDILPAGPRRPNPAEMLSGPRLPEVLAWAESAYDQVLIDSPPALAATDASIVGRLVDGLVLVVQPKKNQRRLVMRAAESLTAVGVRLFGVVVNRISGDKSDSVYGYGSGYGYGYGYGYGNGYGYGEGEPHDAEPQVIPRAPVEVATASETLPPRRAADEPEVAPPPPRIAAIAEPGDREEIADAAPLKSPRKRAPRPKPVEAEAAPIVVQPTDTLATATSAEPATSPDGPRAAPPERPPIVPRRVA